MELISGYKHKDTDTKYRHIAIVNIVFVWLCDLDVARNHA